MDEALQNWRQRHAIDDRAYGELLYILDPPKISSNGDILSENLQSISGSWDNPPNLQIDDDFNFLDGNGQLFYNIEPTQLLNKDTQYFYSNNISTNLIPAPQQPAQMAPPLSESEQKEPACTRCWKWKKRCISTNNGICETCTKADIPSQVCVRVRYADEPVFAKWKNSNYKQKLDGGVLQFLDSTNDRGLIPVFLRHDQQGPVLRAYCCEFVPTSSDQTLLYYKKDQSWEHMQSTPFALKSYDDLDTYVEQYTNFYLQQVGNSGSWIDQIFAEAKKHLNDPLIWNTLKLWAAHRLLMKGCEISEHESLGMFIVTDNRSSLYKQLPAPRPVQNQVDGDLERYIADREVSNLRQLQNAMRGTVRKSWIVIFTSVLIILLIRERDIWRLLYWIYHPVQEYQWRHPEPAATLVRRSLHVTNILLAHVYFSGEVPKQFCEMEKGLRLYQQLQSVNARYQYMDEESVDFSLCSLAFNQHDGEPIRQALAEDFGC